MLPLMGILEDEAERGYGGELVPVGTFASPFQILFNLEELGFLGKRLQHGQAEDGGSMGDGVLAFDLLEVAEVVGVSFAL